MSNSKTQKIAQENYQIVKKNLRLIPRTYLIKTKPGLKKNLKKKNQIEFLKCTTNQAIQYYLSQDSTLEVAVLNFANSHKAGGGYLKGSAAQEEDLCRTGPYLFASLNNLDRKGYYKSWGNNWSSQVLYTPKVPFIREDKNYNLLQNSYHASVITAAAPNLKFVSKSDIPRAEEYENLIKQIYYMPIVVRDKGPKIDVLILGAWGCGAFSPKSDPNYNYFMAERFVKALEEVGGHYKKICFAIMSHSDTKNYDAFVQTFQKNQNCFESVTEI